MKHLFIPYILSILLCSCGDKTRNSSSKKKIVVTTGMIEDAVRMIVRDKADVEALLGPNSDPHMAKASKGDLRLIQSADIIIKNGLHLEGKLGDALDEYSHNTPVYNVSDGIKEEDLMETTGVHDPHIWFNIRIWRDGISAIGEAIIKEDTANANYYKANLLVYLAQLDQLHTYVKEQIKVIPKNKRILITAHDAFRYFGKEYQIEVIGIQGISTLSQTSLKRRTDLSQLIIENQINAIFPEASVRDNQVEALLEDCNSKGYDLKTGNTLYSDALGEQGTEAGDFIGMVKYNLKNIIAAIGI
jgi:manganese/zinc/iron transport system substrate-binding protein